VVIGVLSWAALDATFNLGQPTYTWLDRGAFGLATAWVIRDMVRRSGVPGGRPQ
jgi:hypothetical protein